MNPVLKCAFADSREDALQVHASRFFFLRDRHGLAIIGVFLLDLRDERS